MATARRVVTLIRMTDHAGATLCFYVPSAGRRVPRKFIEPDDVPAFEGESGTFEIESYRAPGVPWLRWRAVRKVDQPCDTRR